MLSARALYRARACARMAATRGFYDAAYAPTLPKFSIIDTTLREGEQFANTEYTNQDRVFIAKTLDKLGVEYIELMNPYASKQVGRFLCPSLWLWL
jgi:homocitrate synthase